MVEELINISTSSLQESNQAEELIAQLDSTIENNAARTIDIANEIRTLLRKHLINRREIIRTRFENGELTGHQAANGIAQLTDEIIIALYKFSIRYAVKTDNVGGISLVAVGGYGRYEMAPFSDVDLLFLLSDKKTAEDESGVEYMLYVLWDLGLKVGHATRTISECLQLSHQDLTIRTSKKD